LVQETWDSNHVGHGKDAKNLSRNNVQVYYTIRQSEIKQTRMISTHSHM
jgi:hypothetical protein